MEIHTDKDTRGHCSGLGTERDTTQKPPQSTFIQYHVFQALYQFLSYLSFIFK